MELPENFLRNIHATFGARGDQWLFDLPDLLSEAARVWELTIAEPMLLSYNYVTAAQRSDGSQVILKIGVPNREFISEMSALRLYAGNGCARLLEANEQEYWMLLERLQPGGMLADVEDDDLRTQIACDVMMRLWRPAPDGLPLIKLTEWFAELGNLRPKYSGGNGPFPARILETVEELIPELFASSSPPVLLHGDFHHFNVLSSGRGWLAIDPKGVIGPAEYECGPLLINPIPDFPYLPGAIRQTGRRIAILSERLGFSRQRIRDWGLCHAILSAWWDISDDDSAGEYALACARVLEQSEI